jgi:hypothetical protein
LNNKINKKNIIFTDTQSDSILKEYFPAPASKYIPTWYKDTSSYHSEGRHSGIKEKVEIKETAATIKKCMPVYDAMTAGYYIFTTSDISVSERDGNPYFIWGNGLGIDFHSTVQARLHPSAQNAGVSLPKFLNRWGIETPKGYSSLFINPMHNPSDIFTVFEGIVDTDKYTHNIHFPFALKDPQWTGTIPAGTPIVQVIPFKRDSWKMSFGGKKELEKQEHVFLTVTSHFFEAYKKFFRAEKEFK